MADIWKHLKSPYHPQVQSTWIEKLLVIPHLISRFHTCPNHLATPAGWRSDGLFGPAGLVWPAWSSSFFPSILPPPPFFLGWSPRRCLLRRQPSTGQVGVQRSRKGFFCLSWVSWSNKEMYIWKFSTFNYLSNNYIFHILHGKSGMSNVNVLSVNEVYWNVDIINVKVLYHFVKSSFT